MEVVGRVGVGKNIQGLRGIDTRLLMRNSRRGGNMGRLGDNATVLFA